MKKLATILMTLLLLNCSSNDNNFSNEIDINLATGINIRSSQFSQPIRLGNPNIFTNNQFIAYPNPPINSITIRSNETISDIWVKPVIAEKIFQETDFNNVLNSNLYTESEINLNSELKFLNMNSSNLSLNLESLNSGYYKIFIKINGIIYWDNIFISSDNFKIDDLINFWN